MSNRNSGGNYSLLLLLPLWLLLLLPSSLRLPAAAGGSGHVVTRMRGFDGPLPFYLETGYVEVDERLGVQLFYYFVQSERDPDEDPLVMWLSGGPGCSVISGLAYEIGPLQFDADGYRGGFPTLLYRPETWTKVSNIIFVDSPVGTGFSYANTKEGLKTGDTKAVKQLLIFLRKWLQDHPRYLSNPVYIAGDSYSGIIIPSLMLEVDRCIELGEKPRFNLKMAKFHIFMAWDLYLMSYTRMLGRTVVENIVLLAALHAQRPSKLYTIAQRDINRQQILEPVCHDEPRSPKTVAEADGASRVMLESANFLSGFKCTQAKYILSSIWANDATIQESLGVRKGTIGTWIRCNRRDLPYTFDIHSTIEYHSRLVTKGYAALIYNGDHDPGITHVGTQAWIRYLNLTIVDDWRPWYVGAQQVAGFTRSYSSNLTFATVKGAGHIAPLYKPLECQKMFTRWVSQNPL